MLKSTNSANMSDGADLFTQAKNTAAQIQAWYHTTVGGYFQPNEVAAMMNNPHCVGFGVTYA